jgi:hypothetical protein
MVNDSDFERLCVEVKHLQDSLNRELMLSSSVTENFYRNINSLESEVETLQKNFEISDFNLNVVANALLEAEKGQLNPDIVAELQELAGVKPKEWAFQPTMWFEPVKKGALKYEEYFKDPFSIIVCNWERW